MSKIIVLKLGGSVLSNLHPTFYSQIQHFIHQGKQIIVVHGGGPNLTETLRRLQISSQFVDGRRITDAHTLPVAKMVLAGSVNKDTVTQFHLNGIACIGLSGVDLAILQANPISSELGFTGEINQVNRSALITLMNQNWVPIIASIGVDSEGQHYNINADEAAMRLAVALQADQLIFISNTDGIYTTDSHGKHPIKQITPLQIKQLQQEKIIHGGMIPKVQAGVQALMNGVNTIHIVNGGLENPLPDESQKLDKGTCMIQEEEEINVSF
ncbi:acetylglutamate kinase [Hazenella sp. IB182357]|uniref:Acetylglutamate kinase n=1 Tax=Polycladospora coralii TaxID=2771432 RepID=A0A926NBW4_9BACL|nr:acetylglutamate kinase [Polycladospora coralii]MBD1372530.1 acetylglutamate kinase [Polycladospora coralii]MBS7531347.1 acetylglutamate kinase [Polycladospora coralii]